MSIQLNKLAYENKQENMYTEQDEFNTAFKQQEDFIESNTQTNKKTKKIKSAGSPPPVDKKQKKKGSCFSRKKKKSKKEESEEVKKIQESVKIALSSKQRNKNLDDVRMIKRTLEKRMEEDTDADNEEEYYEDEKNLQDDMEEVFKNMTEEEKASAAEYTGGGYSNMNYHLRGIQKGDEETQKNIKNLSNMINRTKISKDTVVVRHITLDTLHYLTGKKTKYKSVPETVDELDLETRRNMTIVQDKGFISTSLLPKGAEDFSTLNVEMRILVPKGERGLYVGKNKDIGKVGERELILAPGTKFLILDTQKKADDSKIILYMKTIPIETNQPSEPNQQQP